MYYLIIEKNVLYKAETKKEVEDWFETEKDRLKKELKKMHMEEEKDLNEIFEGKFQKNEKQSFVFDRGNMLQIIYHFAKGYEILKDRIIEINSETYLSPPIPHIYHPGYYDNWVYPPYYRDWQISEVIVDKLKNGEIIYSIKVDGITATNETLNVGYGVTYSFNKDEIYSFLFDAESKAAIYINSQADIIKEAFVSKSINKLINRVKYKITDTAYNKLLIQSILKLNKMLIQEKENKYV